jgi:hypothetical protein
MKRKGQQQPFQRSRLAPMKSKKGRTKMEKQEYTFS